MSIFIKLYLVCILSSFSIQAEKSQKKANLPEDDIENQVDLQIEDPTALEQQNPIFKETEANSKTEDENQGQTEVKKEDQGIQKTGEQNDQTTKQKSETKNKSNMYEVHDLRSKKYDDEEKPNWFMRMIYAIGNFFKNLFGGGHTKNEDETLQASKTNNNNQKPESVKL